MGTVVIDEETGLVMKDLDEDGQSFVSCKGRQRRKGQYQVHNIDVRQAPNFAEAGGFAKETEYNPGTETDSRCWAGRIP